MLTNHLPLTFLAVMMLLLQVSEQNITVFLLLNLHYCVATGLSVNQSNTTGEGNCY